MMEDTPEYEVAKIMRHCKRGRHHKQLEYLVSFVGYDSLHNEWLPAANLANAPRLLQAYNLAYGLV